MTEVANYGDPEGLSAFRETLAEQHPDRLYIFESTAKGFNHWNTMWDEAGRDTITKHRFFIGWWAKEMNAIHQGDPRFRMYGTQAPIAEEREKIDAVRERYGVEVSREQLAWYRWKSSDTSVTEQSTMQNLPWTEDEAFVLSGFSFFQTRVLQKDLIRIRGLAEGTEPVPFHGYQFLLGNDFFHSKMNAITSKALLSKVELRIWEEPDPNGDYVIGIDPAFGRDEYRDRHAIEVWRCYADYLVQVAEYADNKYETRQAAWVAAYLGGAYRNCIINLELTGGAGFAVMTEFDNVRNQLRADMNTERTTALQWEDFVQNCRWYLYHRPDSMGTGYAYGWKTNQDNKYQIMNEMRDSHISGNLIINSAPLVSELLTVTQDGLHLGASGNNKDDRVFASALAHHAWVEWVRPRMIASGLTFEKVQKGLTEENVTEGVVNRIVEDFFRTAEERKEMADEAAKRPDWMVSRGLV